MLQRVHHIDFVVRDLNVAAERFARVLGRRPGPRERLVKRGVEVARFDLGNVWIILVQPVREDSVVMRHLKRHGEGFFHIAYLTADLDAEVRRLKEAGVELVDETPRCGLENWRLVDVAEEETFGATTQIIQEGSG